MSASQRKIAALEAEVAQLRAHMNEATQVIYLLMAQKPTRHISIPGPLFATIPPALRYETKRDPLNQDLEVRFSEPATTGLVGIDGKVLSPNGASGLIVPG
jgi:outer membrane protein TolC